MNFKPRFSAITAAATAFAFLIGAQASHASTISIGDSSVFAAQTTNAIVGNFNDVPTPNTVEPFGSFGGYNPLAGYASLHGVSFSTPNDGGNVNVDSAGFYGSSDLQTPYAVNSVYNGSLADVLTITLPHAETAFALDFNSLFSSTTATFTLSNGYTTSVVTPSALGTKEFIAFLSTTPFDTVTLSVPNDQSFVVADFTQADVLATPLPASWTMMLMALLVLGGMKYRATSQARIGKRSV